MTPQEEWERIFHPERFPAEVEKEEPPFVVELDPGYLWRRFVYGADCG